LDFDDLSSFFFGGRGALLEFSDQNSDSKSVVYLSFPYIGAVLSFIEYSMNECFPSREYRVIFEKIRYTGSGKLIEKKPVVFKKDRDSGLRIMALGGEVNLDKFNRNLLRESLSEYVRTGFLHPVKAGDIFLGNGSLEPFASILGESYPLNRKSALSFIYGLM